MPRPSVGRHIARPQMSQHVVAAVHQPLGRSRSGLHVSYVRGHWYDAFMQHLGSIGFGGGLDWEYHYSEYDNGIQRYCLSLYDLTHVDTAFHIVTSIACNPLFSGIAEVVGEHPWNYTWWERYGATPADTMLREAYVIGNHMHILDQTVQPVEMHQKLGWRLVMPFLDTLAVAQCRNSLPTTVEQYNNDIAPSEQS